MGKLADVIETTTARSIQDMLADSGTDWDAQIVPALLQSGPRGAAASTGGFNAIIRPDTEVPLAFVSERFRANSHRAQLHALSPLVESGLILPRSVSIWDNGAILAYQFSVPSLDVTVHDSDKVGQLLTLMFSYGFKVADMAFFAGFRAFCKNQLGRMYDASNGQRVTHRGDVTNKYADILGNRIQELTGEVQGRADVMRRMLGANLEGRALVEYVGEVIGASKDDREQAWVAPVEDLRGTAARIPEVLECYQADDCGAPGTVWQAYNAVTRYTTHTAGRNPANRLRSALMGTNATINQKAWNMAAELSK